MALQQGRRRSSFDGGMRPHKCACARDLMFHRHAAPQQSAKDRQRACHQGLANSLRRGPKVVATNLRTELLEGVESNSRLHSPRYYASGRCALCRHASVPWVRPTVSADSGWGRSGPPLQPRLRTRLLHRQSLFRVRLFGRFAGGGVGPTVTPFVKYLAFNARIALCQYARSVVRCGSAGKS
jgi:hypothetical protein